MGSDAIEKGFASPYWMTFKQALALDVHVRKIEHFGTVASAANARLRLYVLARRDFTP